MKSSNESMDAARKGVRRSACFLALLSLSIHAFAGDAVPPCFGPENYSTQVALTELVNSGRVADSAAFYSSASTPIGLKTRLLDSKSLGVLSDVGMSGVKVFRQIQAIEARTLKGVVFELLTISEVSDVECSLAAPTVVLMRPEYAVLRIGDTVMKSVKKE